MRVLLVMEATIGGTRRHVVDVARGLARRGVETSLAASAEREPAFRADLAGLGRDGVRVVEIPMVREIRPGTDLRHHRVLVALLRELRPDVVHTHSSKAGVLGRTAGLRTGVGRLVHTPHTFAFLFGAMFSPAKRALFRRIETFLGARTDRLIAVSASDAETIRAARIVAPERIRIVPNGIDPARWAERACADRAALGVPSDAPLAVVAGLLNAAKGQDVALEALARPGIEALHVVFAGNGELREALEAQARRLGVAERAHFLGWRDDVPALFRAADFVLVPSRWEGMPYVVLEAGAAGVPVVGTKVDGLRELVRDGQNGFLAEIDSVDDLARALGRALAAGRPALRAMGARGRERVLTEHGVDTMVERLLAVYGEVA
jgi:glycosyltransferase involved in cell wall biosynthesis